MEEEEFDIVTGKIWDKCMDITKEFQKHPLHSYFIDFEPIIRNIEEKNYDNPSEWFDDVGCLYKDALSKEDPKMPPEKIKKIVISLYNSFSKRANFLNISSRDDWVDSLRGEMMKAKSVVAQCPYPYCVNPKLYEFFEIADNEPFSSPASVYNATKLLQEVEEDKTSNPFERDVSQYYIGALKDKIVNMNNYKFVSRVGGGSFGTVMKEINTVTGKEAAVKYFKNGEINARLIDIFYREVAILAYCKHSCVLPFLGFSTESREKHPSLIVLTEFMKNGSLMDLLSKERTENRQYLTGTNRTLVAFGIALGMQHLHSLEVIHRDLKTMNILLDDHLLPKIADLGLSKFYREDELNTMAIGSKRWMAPEVMFTSDYNKKADVYSYGLILYELLTDRLAYEEVKTLNELVNTVTSGKRPKLPHNTPKGLAKLISVCWETSPHLRPTFDDIVNKFLSEEAFFEDTDPSEFFLTAQRLMELKDVPVDFSSAVARNMIPVVRKKLEEGTDMKYYDDNKKYCLHVATLNNSVEMVNLLLSSPNIDVNAVDENGMTSLHLAVVYNHPQLVKSILSCPKLNVNITDNKGRTALHYATEKCNLCLTVLLSHPSIDVNIPTKDGKTAMYLAVDNNNMDAIMCLLSQQSININAGPKDDTPIVLASRKNYNNILSILISSGKAKMDMKEHVGLLMDAVRAGNVPVVSAMLLSPSIGPVLEQKNQELLRSAKDSKAQMLMLIFAHLTLSDEVIIPLINEAIVKRNMQLIYACLMIGKIDINYRNEKTNPPLIVATGSNNIYAVTLLLKFPQIDVNVHSISWPGFTPLHYAAQNGSVEIAKLLLSMPGIDKKVKSTNEKTPLAVAEDNNKKEIIKLLK